MQEFKSELTDQENWEQVRAQFESNGWTMVSKMDFTEDARVILSFSRLVQE